MKPSGLDCAFLVVEALAGDSRAGDSRGSTVPHFFFGEARVFVPAGAFSEPTVPLSFFGQQ